MRLTFCGHVGFFVETRGGSVLCDPWFTPAYFGSWFPFPRNDMLDVSRFESPDYLYISHLHRDHFDPEWLARHVDKRAKVLLPQFRVPFLERELRSLGFEHFVRTSNGVAHDLGDLSVTILALTEPADGPLGDSLIVLDDGTARVLNQNDARPGDPDVAPCARALRRADGAVLGCDLVPDCLRLPARGEGPARRDKRVNQMARARQYVEWVGAAHVFPCAGPPAFLDDDLFALNDFDRDPANIFPDQTVFLEVLRDAGIDSGELLVPGSTVHLEGGACKVEHPSGDADVLRPFTEKRAYLGEYKRDWEGWLTEERASWSHGRRDLVAELAEWFEPLLQQAAITSAGVAGNVVLDVGEPDANVCIDFVESEVRVWRGEPYVYKADIDRRLLEALLERHTTDWVNSLFLSCRFTAHRSDAANFNEFVMTFFKALTPGRIGYVERCFRERHDLDDEFFERDGWRIERWCPHRQADLTRFGEIADGVLTCGLHHWRFDLATGRCLTSDDRRLRCEKVEEPAQTGGPDRDPNSPS